VECPRFDGVQQIRLVEMLTEIIKAQLLCIQPGRLKDSGELGDLIEGVTIAGAPAILEVVKQGAATLSF
jgi:hypothetical protein